MALSDETEQEKESKPYTYIEHQVTYRQHHFYISGKVIEPQYYTEMVHTIRFAGPESVVYIHLNTPGGVLDTGVQLISAMQASEAHVICSLEGQVASLGTLIFLAADEFVVHDNSMMMFHDYSGGVFGKGHEQLVALEATRQWVEDVMKRLYVPFLSEDEFDRMRKGEDIWVHAEDIRVRLENMVEIKKEELEQQERSKTKTTKKTRQRKTK